MSSLLPAWSALQPFLPEMVLTGGIALVLIIPIISPKKNALGVGIAAGIMVFLALACLLTVQSMGALATDPLAGSV
ncbi:MAG: hypothetical protein WCI73_06880, partial [Phycisphaerae bacterium]